MGIETLVFVALFALSAAISLSAAEKAKGAAARNRGLLYQSRLAADARRIVYGNPRLGGREFYVTSTGTDNEFMHFFLEWGEGPFEAVDTILFDGVAVPLDGSGDATGDFAGFVHIEHKLGSSAQAAIAAAVSEIPEWTTNDRALGICYSWVRLKFDQEKFPNGAPSISAIVRGRNDIYNPVSELTEYTNLVAPCMAHYMREEKLGMRLGATDFDEDDFVEATNVCDENVPLTIGGTEKRYTFDGVISMEDEPEEILDRFTTAMAGNRVYMQKKWHLNAGAYYVPTYEITEDLIVSDVTLDTIPGKMDRINEIRGVYAAPENNYVLSDFPPYSEAAFITEDGEILPTDVELVDTLSVSRSTRIAKILLLRARYSKTVSLSCNIEAIRAVPGKPVYFTFAKLGFSSTPMDILKYGISTEDDLKINLTLKETNSLVFVDPVVDQAGTEPVTAVSTPVAPTNNFGASNDGVSGGLTYSEL